MGSSSRVACVWGANGISGTAMIDLLIEQPRDEWSKIICVSRRPPQLNLDDDRLRFISIDILSVSVDDIVVELETVGGNKITDVFHYMYIEKSSDEELVEVNVELLKKALDACTKIAAKSIKTFSLQTGYKYYGVHKGGEYVAARPFVEDAPRHPGLNFYFNQEDLLKEYAQKNGWRYIITRPARIIGISKGNFMNFAVTVALYATIQKELDKPLLFPGNEKSWKKRCDHSTASNNARFQLWSAVNDKTGNQAFNIADGGVVRSCDLWPKIENYFGMPHHEQTFDNKEQQIQLEDYMPKNKEIWHRIAQRENLEGKAFDYATWRFADYSAKSTVESDGDLTKARKLGWTRTVDTFDSYVQCFDRLKLLKIIP